MRPRQDGAVAVSVLVVTYNHARFVREALDSALAQRLPQPFEILVSEDCSTDGTREIVQEYAERRPHLIRLLLSERNLHSNQVVARGFRAARGRYLALLDGDDYWTDEGKLGNDFLKTLVSVTRKHLLPVRNRIAFIEDGKEVAPGITAMATPGHTVGHASFVINSGSNALMLVADVVHNHVLSLQRPRFPFAHDTDAQQAIKTRVRVLDMLAANRMPMLVYHFPFPGIGNVSKEGEGYRWHPASWQTVL
jgi:glycosyltransferase involved in cell wall biosynthesis